MYLFIPVAKQLAAFTSEQSINSLLIKHLFLHLRGAFSGSLVSVCGASTLMSYTLPPQWRQRVTHYRREREQTGGRKTEKEKGVTFTGGGETILGGRIDGTEAGRLRCGDGEKVKRPTVRCLANYTSAGRWRSPDNSLSRPGDIGPDGYDRGNTNTVDFSLAVRAAGLLRHCSWAGGGL